MDATSSTAAHRQRNAMCIRWLDVVPETTHTIRASRTRPPSPAPSRVNKHRTGSYHSADKDLIARTRMPLTTLALTPLPLPQPHPPSRRNESSTQFYESPKESQLDSDRSRPRRLPSKTRRSAAIPSPESENVDIGQWIGVRTPVPRNSIGAQAPNGGAVWPVKPIKGNRMRRDSVTEARGRRGDVKGITGTVAPRAESDAIAERRRRQERKVRPEVQWRWDVSQDGGENEPNARGVKRRGSTVMLFEMEL